MSSMLRGVGPSRPMRKIQLGHRITSNSPNDEANKCDRRINNTGIANPSAPQIRIHFMSLRFTHRMLGQIG